MSTVTLIGNLFLNRPGSSSSGIPVLAGGIANVARHVKALDPYTRVRLQSALGKDTRGDEILGELEALDLDLEGIRRVSGPDTAAGSIPRPEDSASSGLRFGACESSRYFERCGSSWYHLAYLDSMRGLERSDLLELREDRRPLSADLCLGELADDEVLRLEELIGELDYLTLSEDECRALRGHAGREAARELGRMVRGWAVLHRPTGSWSSDGRRVFETRVEERSGVIPGAGDAFAAALIHFGLRGFAIEAMAARAHEWATDALLQVPA